MHSTNPDSPTNPGSTVDEPPNSAPVQFRSTHALLALASLYTLYFAKPLIMPIVVALMLSLLLSPIVSVLKRLHIPRSFSAVLLITLLVGPFVLLSIELAAPAQKWATRIPQLTAQLTHELDELGKTFAPDTTSVEAKPAPPKRKFNLFSWFQSEEPAPEEVEAPASESMIVEEVKKGGVEVMLATLSATPKVFAQFTIVLVLLLFILVFGPGLYNNLVELLPFVRNNRHATLLVGRVRQELSRYMFTVSLINFTLGGLTALILAWIGMEDALLWGVLVGLMNFAPYVGPIVAMATLGIAGVAQYGLELSALIPALALFLLNTVEAQFVTPTVLGTHMRLNPLVLIIWIFTWGWLWGPIGVLVAVPMLVCIKLVVAQLGILRAWVTLIETRA